MMDDLKKCLEIICDFPTIYKSGDKSPLTIIGQSGYADKFEQVTELEILKFVDKKAGLVKTWTQYTEDIRHNRAWGLHDSSKSKWTVLYMDDGKIKTEFKFDNPYEACAKMIKVTMEEIRMR